MRSVVDNKKGDANPFADCISFLASCGGLTRTDDLWVMSPTSYQLLHSAILFSWRKGTPIHSYMQDVIICFRLNTIKLAIKTPRHTIHRLQKTEDSKERTPKEYQIIHINKLSRACEFGEQRKAFLLFPDSHVSKSVKILIFEEIILTTRALH